MDRLKNEKLIGTLVVLKGVWHLQGYVIFLYGKKILVNYAVKVKRLFRRRIEYSYAKCIMFK